MYILPLDTCKYIQYPIGNISRQNYSANECRAVLLIALKTDLLTITPGPLFSTRSPDKRTDLKLSSKVSSTPATDGRISRSSTIEVGLIWNDAFFEMLDASLRVLWGALHRLYLDCKQSIHKVELFSAKCICMRRTEHTFCNRYELIYYIPRKYTRVLLWPERGR